MFVKKNTDKTVSVVTTALPFDIQANHVGVMQVYNLKVTMAKKCVVFVRKCQIFQIYKPQKSKKVPAQNMDGSADWRSVWQ